VGGGGGEGDLDGGGRGGGGGLVGFLGVSGNARSGRG